MELTCTEWVSVEAEDAPCDNELVGAPSLLTTSSGGESNRVTRVKGQEERVTESPESNGWTFLTLEGEQSIQTFWYRLTTSLDRGITQGLKRLVKDTQWTVE